MNLKILLFLIRIFVSSPAVLGVAGVWFGFKRPDYFIIAILGFIGIAIGGALLVGFNVWFRGFRSRYEANARYRLDIDPE